MDFNSKHKSSEIENLLDKAKNDYTIKQYADYAGYNADTSRPSNTISLIKQDNSVWVRDKQYSMNAGCYVGSDKADVSTTAWYLAGTLNVAMIGWDVQYLGYCTNSLLSDGGGLFIVNLRFNSATDIQIKKFAWLAKTGSTPNLRLVVSEGKVQLYVFVAGGQYRGANVRILTESTSAKRANTSGARNFFGLSDNTVPETIEPVGTDIADVPYLLKTAAAAGSEKVLQTKATSSAERRVLLGENHETTQQDKVYKSPGLTFNPSTKTLTVPQVNGNAATATKAMQDGNGVDIAGNYQRVYKSSFHVTADGWYKLAYRPRIAGGLLDWKDKYILVDVLSRQGGSCQASFKILYSSHAGWMAAANNEFICIPLTTTNYACISNVRLLSRDTSVLGNTFIELYVQLSKGGNNASTDVEISIESNIPNTYLYNIATAGEADTSTYTVITRNAVTSPYGGTSAIGGLVAEKALSANKLATSRKIGFAPFNGSADISLNYIQGKFQLRWTTNTTQWQRVIRFKTKTAYTKRSFLIAVRDTESLHFSGILRFDVGTLANTTSIIHTVQWVALSNRVYENIDFFRVYKINPTETDEYLYIDLYANSPYQYIDMSFNVLTINDIEGVTLGGSGEWLELSAIPGTFLSSSKGVHSTDSAFLQSLEGLSHKSVDSSLDLRRRTEYICGQQVLSDTEEAGKAFYGSSANPLVISVPLKDPADAVAGGKVNVNIIRFYYADTYWQELFFCVNTQHIYTRWVANGNARPWYRVVKEDNTIEYNAWVTKATAADLAAVANKTKYPIVFKRNGASITNWFADTTFTIDIPEELLDYSAPTGITLKVPEISFANEAKKVSNKLSLTVNGSTTEYDGSAGARVSIKANCTHIVKANSNSSLGTLYPEQTGHPSAVTVPVSMLPLEPYNSAAGGLNDGDTLILHVPNSMANPTANYVWCVKLDITKENTTDNIIPLIHGQNAGTPVFWNTSTTIPAGFYQFVYSATLGGLVYMYRNTATT